MQYGCVNRNIAGHSRPFLQISQPQLIYLSSLLQSTWSSSRGSFALLWTGSLTFRKDRVQATSLWGPEFLAVRVAINLTSSWPPNPAFQTSAAEPSGTETDSTAVRMSPSETTAQAQAQDEDVLEQVDEGEGEENRSQLEAKDDAALLVCLFPCRTYLCFMQGIC